MDHLKLSLSVLPDKFAVSHFPKDARIPAWATENKFFSITRTDDELSIICHESNVPDDISAEKNWRLIKILEKLDFSIAGILASLVAPLAKAGISILIISTYDTDYLMLKDDKLDQAVKVLSEFCKIDK